MFIPNHANILFGPFSYVLILSIAEGPLIVLVKLYLLQSFMNFVYISM